MHGLWQSAMPSRFLDELPEAHVEVDEAKAARQLRRLLRIALRRDDLVRLALRDAGLATRAGRKRAAAALPRPCSRYAAQGRTYSSPSRGRARERERSSTG